MNKSDHLQDVSMDSDDDDISLSSSLKTPNSVCTSRNPSSDLDDSFKTTTDDNFYVNSGETEDINTPQEEAELVEEQRKWVTEGPQTAKCANPKKFFCPVCTRGFTTQGNMRRHRQIAHGGGKQFKCEICNKDFVENQSLQVHIKTVHMGIKEFECTFCGKTCGTKSALKSHVLKVHGNSKFVTKKTVKCHLCQAVFHHSGNLKRHVQNFHQNQFNYHCDICGKKLKSKQSLMLHINSQHEMSRRHPCDLCYNDRLKLAGSSTTKIPETIFPTRGALLNHLNSIVHQDNPNLQDAIAKAKENFSNPPPNGKVEIRQSEFAEIPNMTANGSLPTMRPCFSTSNASSDKKEWWCELCYGGIDRSKFKDKALISLFKNKVSLLAHLNSLAHRDDPRLPEILAKVNEQELEMIENSEYTKHGVKDFLRRPVFKSSTTAPAKTPPPTSSESVEICVKEEIHEEEEITFKEEFIDDDDIPLSRSLLEPPEMKKSPKIIAKMPIKGKPIMIQGQPKIKVKLAGPSVLSKIKFKPLSILGTTGPVTVKKKPSYTVQEIIVKEEAVNDDDDYFVQN